MSIYLDHAATTPVLPEAIAAYVGALGLVGNPSSIHSQGQNAKRMLEEAREGVAASLGCDPIEVVFTANGTEAINLALKGLFWSRPGTRIIVAEGEHHATIDSVEWLRTHEGAEIDWVPLDAHGHIDLAAYEAALARDSANVAVATALWANNEVGTIQDAIELASLCARYDVPLHLDAVAAYGHIPVDFVAARTASGSTATAGLVALSVSAHKIGGPVGIGALVLGRGRSIEPLIHGGGQQRQVRSGTQDVAAAVSFAAAASIAVSTREDETLRVTPLRDRLEAAVLATIPGASVNGDRRPGGRLAGTAHFSFANAQGDSMLFLLDIAGISVSTGSACQAGVPEASHVLRAMGRTEAESRGALRVTLGRTTVDADIDALLAALPAVYAQATRAGMADRQTSFDPH